jgi:hypothetical protein
MDSNTNTLPQAVERPALASGDLLGVLGAALNDAEQCNGARLADYAPHIRALFANAHGWQRKWADAADARDNLWVKYCTLESLLQQMLHVAENCDETGYADGVGFVDIDKLHEEVREALSPNT